MDILFENQYERTKKFHKEIYTYSFFKRPIMLALYIVLSFIFILCILSMLFLDIFQFENAARIVSIIPIVVVVMIVRYFRVIDISYKRDLELNNGEPAKIIMTLTNEGIETCRANTESKNHISFQCIMKIITTHNYYLLLTEAKHYIVFKKDGFCKGTPDEFLSFIKGKIVKSTKKSKRQIVLIWLVGIAALSVVASLYILNGRTIFENRSEPTEAELEKIHEILAYEQEKLSECMERLSQYDDGIKGLGIEIRPELDRTRAVNNQGLVEKHDWDKDFWLPKFYSSKIRCTVYKDGKMLENRTSYNSISLFVDIFWLLYAGKNEDIYYNENPFDSFDMSLDRLLNQVSIFLQK